MNSKTILVTGGAGFIGTNFIRHALKVRPGCRIINFDALTYAGTYHYCGKGATTWHGFAEKIFDLARQYDSIMVKEIVPITTEEYPTSAKRPSNSVLDCSLITVHFNISPRAWQESLVDMLDRYYQ